MLRLVPNIHLLIQCMLKLSLSIKLCHWQAGRELVVQFLKLIAWCSSKPFLSSGERNGTDDDAA